MNGDAKEIQVEAGTEKGVLVRVGGRSTAESERPKGEHTLSVGDLIRYSREHPPEPVIEGLLSVGDTLLLHGLEESYKSFWMLQMGESLSMGRPFLRSWIQRRTWRVGLFETEMHPSMLGTRLATMFPDGNPPDDMVFLDEEMMKEWRRGNLENKFEIIECWIRSQELEVLLIDTANDFFRGNHNPSDERIVGEFLDRIRNLDIAARVLVRHDRKQKTIDREAHSNELIRGSAEWKEDPEAIVYLKRPDKRTNQVNMEVGKLRYGKKPDALELWFDAGYFRLTPLPPVMAVLETSPKSRQELIADCQERFGVEARLVDAMISELRPFLREERNGHDKVFHLDSERCLDSEWAGFLRLGP